MAVKYNKSNLTVIFSDLNTIFRRVSVKEFFAKLIMLSLKLGYITARNRTLANMLNTTESVIKNLIALLKKQNLIKVEYETTPSGYQQRRIYIVWPNELYDLDELYFRLFGNETLLKSNETLPKGQVIRLPLKERQKNDNRKKTEKQKNAHTPTVILSDQPSLPSHKPAASVSDFAVFDMCEKTKSQAVSEEDYYYLLKCLMGFNMPEQQARNLIEKYSYDIVLDKVNYVRSRDGIDNKGGYLMAVLKAYGRKNGISSNKKTTSNNTQHLMEKGESEGETHWREGKKAVTQLLKDKNMSLDLLVNSVSLSHKPIILEFLSIFDSYPRPYPGKAIDELLEDKNITLPVLKQKLQENLSIIESIESTDNTEDAEVFIDDNHSENVHNQSENVQSEAVNDAVSTQSKQGFISNVDSVNDAVKSQNWGGENLNNLTDKQQKIIDYLKLHGSGAIRDFEPLIGMSKASVKTLLKQMQDLKIIITYGAGRSLRYKLAR